MSQDPIPQEELTDDQFYKMVAKAWLDEEFRTSLQRDPTTTVKAFALEEFNVDLEKVILIPGRPSDLSEEHLQSVLAGSEELRTAKKTSCAIV